MSAVHEMALQAVDASDTFGAEVVDSILLIPTHLIQRGERLREIDPVWAGALGQLMARDGQQTPVEVCRLPGRTDWLLVAGGHRHAGAEAEGIENLRAIVVSANRDDRRLREVNENLWRRDLDPIDRAAFIAEAVSIQKRRAGLTDAARVAKVNVGFREQVDEEASDMLETISSTYGWSDEVGEQLGFTGRTIRNDLYLYRRLAPSLIARLRAASHPVARNATQLRALAKLEPGVQASVVDALVGDNGCEPSRTVAEAVKKTQPTAGRVSFADPDQKHLSAFLGAFERLSVAGRKSALAHLRAQLPAGFRIEEGEPAPAQATFPAEHERYREEALEIIDAVREQIDGLEEDEAIPGDRGIDLYQAARRLQLARMTIAGNGFALSAPEEAVDGPGGDLLHIIATIEQMLDDKRDASWIVGEVARRFDGKARYVSPSVGYQLRLAGIATTCTAGEHGLLTNWMTAARRRLSA